MKDVLVIKTKNFTRAMKNSAGYHPGPVAPSATDGAPIARLLNGQAMFEASIVLLSSHGN